MNKILPLLSILLLVSACASGPSLDRARAKKLKRVAIIAMVVDQEATGGIFQDADLAKKAGSAALMGSFNSKGQVIYGDYAKDIIESANSKITNTLKWQTMKPVQLMRNMAYSKIENKLNRNFLTSKAGAPEGYLRYGIKQMIFAHQLYDQAPKYEKIRKNLIRELNVDAVALLSVTLDTPTDGIGVSLGRLAKFESGDYKPKIYSSLDIYDRRGYVGKIEIKKESESTYKKEKLREGFVKLFKESFQESLNATKKEIL